MVGVQRRCHHRRAQVGATDADVDDGANTLTRVTAPVPFSHSGREGTHARQHVVHCRHDILTVNPNGYVGAVPQSHVQDRPALRVVDLLPRVHAFDGRMQID